MLSRRFVGISLPFLPCLLIALLGLRLNAAADAEAPEPRTLLVELRNVPWELRATKSGVQRGPGRYSYDSYDRARVLSVVRDTVMLTANQEELAELQAEGLQATVLLESGDHLELVRRALYGPTSRLDPIYHTYDEIVAKAASLAEAHPELIARIQIGVTTQFKRPIYAYRLSNEAATVQDRPAVMLNGCHHADELIGAEIVTALMEKLVTGYGHDEEVTGWMDTLEIWLVPVVNVDGHDIVTSGRDPRWRKNARDLNGDGEVVYSEGVDVNRGYDFNWAMGGTDDVSGVSYRGRYPFSEAENRAMRTLAERRAFVASIAYHSQGEVIYYPWSWGGLRAPDDAVIKGLVNAVAGQLRTMDGRGTYEAVPGGPSSQSYPWFYGRKGSIDFIIEVGRGAHVFPAAEVPGLVATNLEGIAALMARAAGPGLAVRVADAATGEPLTAEVWLPRIENETVDRRHSDARFGRLWRLLEPGDYTLIISKPGYVPQRLDNVTVSAEGWTELEVDLAKDASSSTRSASE